MLSPIKILTMALAAAPFVISAATPAQMVKHFGVLTEKSRALQGPAKSITIVNGPLIIIGQGPFPKLIAGFTDIISMATGHILAMQDSATVNDPKEAQAIADVFKEFVFVHQALLNILIGKAGLFQAIPLIGAPVAAVLRQVEGVVDTVALALIDKVPSKEKELKREGESLGMTLDTAIGKYEGLAILKRAINFKS